MRLNCIYFKHYLINVINLCRRTESFNYIGKIVLKIRDEESKKVVVPAPKKVLAVPKTFVDPENTYVVIGVYRFKLKKK